MSSSKLDVDELERIASAATPGPWTDCASFIEGGPVGRVVAVTPSPHARAGSKPGQKWRRDRAFIATFDPPTVLRLLAERKALVEEVSRAADYLDALGDNLLRHDADMQLGDCEDPKDVAERLRAALALTGGQS